MIMPKNWTWLSMHTTKVVFRNRGKVHENEKWHIYTDQIEVLHTFIYLGVLLNYKKILCLKFELTHLVRPRKKDFKKPFFNL